MHPSVSIIVPVYGVEKYLDRCVESLVKQTLTNIEIILVDDGSPDNCPRMCDDWAHRDSRIKVIHKPNAGQGFARNSGIEIATGEYIAFVDSDDYVEPDTYATLYAEASNNGYDGVFNGFSYFHPDGSKEERGIVDDIYLSPDAVSNYIANLLCDVDTVISAWAGIYRTSIIIDNGIRFVSERKFVSEDLLFNIDFAVKASRLRSLPRAFYNYCYNGNSFSQIFKKQKIKNMFRLFETIRERLESNNLASINHCASRFFLDNMVGMIKCFMISNLSESEKYNLACEVCNYPNWKVVAKELSKHSDLKMQNRILLFLVKNHLPALCYFFFTVYYKLLFRNKTY